MVIILFVFLKKKNKFLVLKHGKEKLIKGKNEEKNKEKIKKK